MGLCGLVDSNGRAGPDTPYRIGLFDLVNSNGVAVRRACSSSSVGRVRLGAPVRIGNAIPISDECRGLMLGLRMFAGEAEG